MIMKTWTMPRIAVDTFVPNEFVALCVTVGEGGLNGMWEETNGIPGLQNERHNVLTQESYKRYAEYPNLDYTGATEGQVASDHLYSNDEGWFYVRLKSEPVYVNAGYHGDVGTFDTGAYVFYGDDGTTYYQTWNKGTDFMTNHS